MFVLMAMQGYTKLFNSILASTIWSEPDHTRITWITMLAMADKDGMVSASVPGLAALARISVEKCEEALVTLSSPDRYSRTKELEGRRIAEIDGGWQLLNYEKYKKKLSAEERREYLAAKQREYRARDKRLSTNVDNVSDTDTRLTHSDSDSDSDSQKQTTTRVFSTPSFEKFWEAYPVKLDKKEANREWFRVPFAEKSVGTILAGLEIWKSSDRWKEEQYIPAPAKFLRLRRWESNPPKKAETKNEQARRKTQAAIARVRENLGMGE